MLHHVYWPSCDLTWWVWLTISSTPRHINQTPIIRVVWAPYVSSHTYNRYIVCYTATAHTVQGHRLHLPVSLTGQAHVYLADDLSPGVGVRCLCSSDVPIPTCVIPRMCTQFSDRRFSTAGLRLWNALLLTIRHRALSFDCFERRLKTQLFCC